MTNDLQLLNITSGQLFSTDADDLSFGSDGDLVLISGHARKLQDVVKIMLTTAGEDGPYPSYGTTLNLLINSRLIPTSTLQNDIASAIWYALSYLKSIDKTMDPTEQITQIVSVTVTPTSVSDPRGFSITLTVQLADGSIITTPPM
jgi:hypothetical protein